MSVGIVVGGRGAPWCRKPVGRRFRFDPCMPGGFGVCRLACGLFMTAPLLPQRFGWCMVVLGALWSACSSLGLFCCCWRCRVLGSVGYFGRRPVQPVTVSRRGLGLVVAVMSDAGFLVLRPGCSWRVVLVRRRRSSTRLACRGSRCCPHWFGRLCARLVWVCRCCVVASVTLGRFGCRGLVCAA